MRAVYLLKLLSGIEGLKEGDNENVDQMVIMEVFELREQIEEAEEF